MQIRFTGPPQKRKDVENEAAILKIVNTYVKEAKILSEEEDELDGAAAAEEDEVETENDKWLKSPELILLTAIANISRL